MTVILPNIYDGDLSINNSFVSTAPSTTGRFDQYSDSVGYDTLDQLYPSGRMCKKLSFKARAEGESCFTGKQRIQRACLRIFYTATMGFFAATPVATAAGICTLGIGAVPILGIGAAIGCGIGIVLELGTLLYGCYAG